VRTARAEFTKKTMEQAWERANGNCEYCHLPFDGRRPEYHHHISAALGGGNSLENCRCICVRCHREVTKTEDLPRIVKAKALEEKRAGLRRSKTRWPKQSFRRAG
jgi:5-methylcytosine-specific restriction endonuclease McrA